MTSIAPPQTDRVEPLPGQSWDRPLLLALFLLGLCHSQTVIPIAAPASLTLLALVASRRRLWFGPHCLAATVLVGYLFVVAAINGNLTGVGPVSFVMEYGPALYACSLLALLLAVRWRPSEAGAAMCALLLGVASIDIAGLLIDVIGTQVLGEALSIKGRLKGFLTGPNAFAGSTGTALLLAIALGLKSTGRPATLARWTIAPFGIAFLSTVSRGYTLGLIAACLYMAVQLRGMFRKPSRFFVAIAAIAVIVPVLFFQLADRVEGASEDASVNTRLLLFERAFGLWADSPLTGVGIGTFEQRNVELVEVVPGVMSIRVRGEYQQELTRFDAEGGQHTHNVILQTLVDGGIIAFALMGYLIVSAWRAAADPKHNWLHLYVRSATVFLLVSGFTGGLTLYSASIATLPYLSYALVLTQQPESSSIILDRAEHNTIWLD